MKIFLENIHAFHNNLKDAENGKSESDTQKRHNLSSGENRDDFTFKEENGEETLIYEKYKRNSKELPDILKLNLIDLLEVLENSKKELLDIDGETAVYRDFIISEIKNMLNREEIERRRKMQENIERNSNQSIENFEKQSEFYSKQMKTMKACIKIFTKIRDNTASREEIRFIMKHNPTLYTLAMAKKMPQISENKNKTTVDLGFEKDDNTEKNSIFHTLNEEIKNDKTAFKIHKLD